MSTTDEQRERALRKLYDLIVTNASRQVLVDQWTELVSIINKRAPNEPADARDALRFRGLRDIQCVSLTVSRNDEHAPNYMTAADWIDEHSEDFEDDAADEVARMKATNMIWTVQVYPSTPVGFNLWHGATLESAIDAALTRQAAAK